MGNSTLFKNPRYGIVWSNVCHTLEINRFVQVTNDGRWCAGFNGCVYVANILFWSEDEELIKVICKEIQKDISNDKLIPEYRAKVKEYESLEDERIQRVIQNTLEDFKYHSAEQFV